VNPVITDVSAVSANLTSRLYSEPLRVITDIVIGKSFGFLINIKAKEGSTNKGWGFNAPPLLF
jgi:hypothetical protein